MISSKDILHLHLYIWHCFSLLNLHTSKALSKSFGLVALWFCNQIIPADNPQYPFSYKKFRGNLGSSASNFKLSTLKYCLVKRSSSLFITFIRFWRTFPGQFSLLLSYFRSFLLLRFFLCSKCSKAIIWNMEAKTHTVYKCIRLTVINLFLWKGGKDISADLHKALSETLIHTAQLSYKRLKQYFAASKSHFVESYRGRKSI